MRSQLLALASASLLAASSPAQLRFTEAMSSGGTADWFEITNFGSSAVDITGFKIDDNSFTFGNSVSLVGVTSIAAGQSVVFIETAAPGTDIAAFRTFWGGIDSVTIGSYTGSAVGLSSGGDGLALFDSGGTEITRVSFGAAVTGSSFGYNADTGTFGAISQAGSYGAFVSANGLANIGSPGAIVSAVPEPSTFAALAGLCGLAFAGARRRRRA